MGAATGQTKFRGEMFWGRLRNRLLSGEPFMKIIITGSSGMIGSALVAAFASAGHEVVQLVRHEGAAPGAVMWDPMGESMNPVPLEGVDAVVHLSGENLAQGRWTETKKKRLVDSRVRSTSLLSRTLAQLQRGPRVMVCASGIGIYGDRGDEVLTEDAKAGTGFAADLCQQWEAAAAPAVAAGIRVIHIRMGIVLAHGGGALAKMLTPFRLGFGGVIGSGRQYVGWIALEDVIGAVMHLIDKSELAGPVNFVAPQEITNRQLTKTLGHVLHRPTVLAMPAMAARLAFGEMADELLLTSERVTPQRLLNDGFVFQYPELKGALEHAISGGDNR
jgi:uncharacterized protein